MRPTVLFATLIALIIRSNVSRAEQLTCSEIMARQMRTTEDKLSVQLCEMMQIIDQLRQMSSLLETATELVLLERGITYGALDREHYDMQKRKHEYLRFGKRKHEYLRFGKRKHEYLRFG